MATFDDYVGGDRANGADLLGSQPTQGNITGGLSTIEEKALGNIEKTGTKPVVDALQPAEAPAGRRPVLHGQLLGGGRIHHAHGRRRRGRAPVPDRPGQRHRQPVEPVIKLTGNPLTAATMSEHIDLDVCGLLCARAHTRPRRGSA